jgi:hypothetical protein
MGDKDALPLAEQPTHGAFVRISINSTEETLQNVGKIVLIEGGKGGMAMVVYDRANMILQRTSSAIQNVEELLEIIRQRLPAHGVNYEYRDKWD